MNGEVNKQEGKRKRRESRFRGGRGERGEGKEEREKRRGERGEGRVLINYNILIDVLLLSFFSFFIKIYFFYESKFFLY